jgi:hypothetical protein
MEMQNFIIGLVVISLFVGGIGMFMGELNTQYGNPGGYNESDLTSFNKMNDLSDLNENLTAKMKSTGAKTGVADILGGFVSSAVDTVKIAWESINIFHEMTISAMEKVGLPRIFTDALITIVGILIIFYIIKLMVG